MTSIDVSERSVPSGCLALLVDPAEVTRSPGSLPPLVPDSAAVVWSRFATQVFAMAAGVGTAPTQVGDVEEDASQLLFPKGAELCLTSCWVSVFSFSLSVLFMYSRTAPTSMLTST